MNLAPNRTRMDVEITKISKAKDGWGSVVGARVVKKPRSTKADFIKPAVDQTLELFAADDSKLEVGKRFSLTASVIGGPRGERMVIQKAEALDAG